MLVLRQVQRQVKKLIAGPSVYICDDCVEPAVEIIREDLPDFAREGDPET